MGDWADDWAHGLYYGAACNEGPDEAVKEIANALRMATAIGAVSTANHLLARFRESDWDVPEWVVAEVEAIIRGDSSS